LAAPVAQGAAGAAVACGGAAPRPGSGVGKRGPAVGVGGDDLRAEFASQEVKGVGVCVRVVSVPRRGFTHAPVHGGATA
jgi:hypothetical protein